jgi:hypothetical protein
VRDTEIGAGPCCCWAHRECVYRSPSLTVFDSVQILNGIRHYVGTAVLSARFKILVFWNVMVLGHVDLYPGANTSGASAASHFGVLEQIP